MPKPTHLHHRARQHFDRNGLSIALWAEQHGFTASLVYAVLSGRKPGHRGKSHHIAVLLGIKQGLLPDGTVPDLRFLNPARRRPS